MKHEIVKLYIKKKLTFCFSFFFFIINFKNLNRQYERVRKIYYTHDKKLHAILLEYSISISVLYPIFIYNGWKCLRTGFRICVDLRHEGIQINQVGFVVVPHITF